jgi:hypothetical protein
MNKALAITLVALGIVALIAIGYYLTTADDDAPAAVPKCEGANCTPTGQAGYCDPETDPGCGGASDDAPTDWVQSEK